MSDEQQNSPDPKTQTESSAADAAPKPEGDLPEEIELTPEIVEDEAIRNDFMLRLAVVLLAVLVACTEINETRTLVHIKTGEYLGSHGVLPPRTDVFTHTALETPWINLSWLFDLFSAGSFAVGGAVALTVIKSLLAGVVFYFLLKAVRRDVPTWWASICAGLAVIVAAPQFTFEPHLITLVGMSLTLWLLFRFLQAAGPATLWALLPVFWVWSNMDPRAYLGLIVLMLITLGELLGIVVGRSFLNDESNRGHLWLFVPAALVVYLIHPFGWETLLSPANLYLFEYPAWREVVQSSPGGSLEAFLPLWDPAVWKTLTFPTIAALVLAATVPVTFALNWRNVTPAHVLLYLGMLGLGIANSHDLAAVSLVFAVLAAHNAQEWYAESFRQSYSIELSERLFSVGGRAVTAIAFFGLAFLAITGRLLGKTENRLGFGFDRDLSNQIAELQTDLEKTKPPGNAFNFSVGLGDVLIWLDHPPFIDSRLNLFAKGGSPDSLFAEHQTILGTWKPLPPEEDETVDAYQKRNQEVFKLRREKLNEHEIVHAVIPLGPALPTQQYYGYLVSLEFGARNNWRLVRLGPMAGWFYRLDPDRPTDREYLNEHVVNHVDLVFRTEAEDLPDQPHIAASPTWTDKWFSLKAGKANPPEMLLSIHYDHLLSQLMGLLQQYYGQFGRVERPDSAEAISMAYMAIRHGNRALEEDPNSALAYRVLANSNLQLRQLEQEVGRLQVVTNRRYYRAVACLNQAIKAEPDSAQVHLELGRLYRAQNQFDLALRELNRVIEIVGPPEEDEGPAADEYERWMRAKKDLEAIVERVQTEVDNVDPEKVSPIQIANFCHQKGCTLLALKALEQGGDFPQNDPNAQLWRLEAGQVEDAYLAMRHLETQLDAALEDAPVKQFGLSPNQSIRSAIATAALAVGDYERAIKQWTRQAEEVEQQAMLHLLGTLPMANRPTESSMFLRIGDDWPTANWLSAERIANRMPPQTAPPLLNAALCYLEIGQPKKAAELFQRLLEIHPESGYRTLLAFYIALTANEDIEPLPSSYFIPVWDGMFAPGPAAAENDPAVAEKPEK